MKTTEQNENNRTKVLLQKWCFASNLLIKYGERDENGMTARVKSVSAARFSALVEHWEKVGKAIKQSSNQSSNQHFDSMTTTAQRAAVVKSFANITRLMVLKMTNSNLCFQSPKLALI